MKFLISAFIFVAVLFFERTFFPQVFYFFLPFSIWVSFMIFIILDNEIEVRWFSVLAGLFLAGTYAGPNIVPLLLFPLSAGAFLAVRKFFGGEIIVRDIVPACFGLASFYLGGPLLASLFGSYSGINSALATSDIILGTAFTALFYLPIFLIDRRRHKKFAQYV